MKLVGFDVETQGDEQTWALEPFRARTGGARVSSVAWVPEALSLDDALKGVGQAPAIMHDPTREDLATMLRRAIDERVWVCAWNAAFDVAWLYALDLGDLADRARWLDGMLLWKHCVQTPTFYTGDGARFTFGLKEAVAETWPDHAGYGEGIDFADNAPEARAARLRYNVMDAWFTVQLCRRYLDQMPDLSRRNALIEAQSIPLVARTTVEGIRGNRGKAVILAEKLADSASSAFGTLQQDGSQISEATLRSPIQLRKVIYDEWGLPVSQTTKTGAASTGRAALVELAPVDERAMQVNAYREANNNLTKFAIGLQRSLDYNGDGYTRPSAKIYGTYTGRMTFSSKVGKGKSERPAGVPIHQWKRDPEFRDTIDPPPGYDLLEFDFAGQEFRWMAIESGDATMLALCAPGEDPHSYMGAQIAATDYKALMSSVRAADKSAKRSRQLGKVGNLSLQYRTSAKRLKQVAKVQHKLDLSDHEAQDIWSKYRRTYPGVPRYWQRQIDFVRRNRFVITLAGRRVHIPELSQRMKWSIESTAINFPIQGIGADQKYLALMCGKDTMRRYGARFYFELHDGLFFVCPSHNAYEFARALKPVLSNLPYERAWGLRVPIELPVDAKIGKSWGSLKELQD